MTSTIPRGLYVAGQWAATAGVRRNVCPADMTPIGAVAECTSADAAAAVSTARAAFATGTWPSTPERVRGDLLLRVADLLERDGDVYAKAEALDTGKRLAEAELTFLDREPLDAADRHWIPVKRSWRLNERHYGALQGKDKKQTLDEYGEEQFMLWRRSFDTPPPPLDDSSEFSQAADPRYADLGDELPRTECLKDVIARFLPYWEAEIVPDLQSGRTVLVAAHGNSLRALVKHLDQISDEDIAGLNIPTGMPLVYELDDAFQPVVKGGQYLDPEAAAAAAAAVANQGR